MRSFGVLLSLAIPAIAATGPAPETSDFFETRIRPVLASHCNSCHTDSKLGGLRVDSRDALLKGGKTGPAIVAGDPDKSLLIRAVRQTDPKLAMPMGGAKLKDTEIADLATWIKAGAVWPDGPAPVRKATITEEQRAFWSFQPLHKPAVPDVKNPKWAKTDIDRFVLAKLEKEGLTPVRLADKRTLIRRATLDLTGLPPTAEDIKAFENDKSSDAYAKVIDRLLDSPQYGERWGRFWLDVARYGEDDYRSLDPKGRGNNPYPFAYLYRDWVVKSFNDDMPYDLFVKSQIAGDLLDPVMRVKTLPGTGFLGGGPWYYDNGAVEITHADERHDRVDVVTRGFLGVTVGCARCHDHKYDPIPTTDYYALAGVFLNTVYHEYPMVPKSTYEEFKAKEKAVENKEKLLGKFTSDESSELAQTLAFQASKYMVAAWKVTGEPKEEFTKVVDEEKLDYELFDRWVKFLAKPPKHYPDLVKWQEMVKGGGALEEAKKLAEEFQKRLIALILEKNEIREENEIIVAKSLPTTKPRKFAEKPNEFVTNDDFCPGCGLQVKTLPLESMNLWTDVFSTDLDGPDFMMGQGKRPHPGLLMFRGWGLERQLSAERRAYMEALKKNLEESEKALEPEVPYVHGVADVEKPANLRVSLRGSPYNLGDEVPRRFLSVLSKDPVPFTQGSGRLELAEAIVQHPISTRVIVNRVWKAHMVTGIVDTPSNFGMTGERPTNPELLEYLAQWFVDNGKSIKKLHREIMLSTVYQLNSDFVEANNNKDGGNRFYWRANRRRMDAEQIRDSILLVAGRLDTKIGGPSSPLAPEFKRRTLYGKVSRYKLDEYLQLFDFPSPNLTSEKRFTTTVPLQRLFFMNSEFVQQQAEYLARRLETEPETPARIQKAYQILYGRAATDDEVQAGIEYLKAEPMKEYEEAKAREQEKKAKEAEKGAVARRRSRRAEVPAPAPALAR
jgi:mono/diheme cytochrome c family protein/cytochrome c553